MFPRHSERHQIHHHILNVLVKLINTETLQRLHMPGYNFSAVFLIISFKTRKVPLFFRDKSESALVHEIAGNFEFVLFYKKARVKVAHSAMKRYLIVCNKDILSPCIITTPTVMWLFSI